jgi:hypothetical protein
LIFQRIGIHGAPHTSAGDRRRFPHPFALRSLHRDSTRSLTGYRVGAGHGVSFFNLFNRINDLLAVPKFFIEDDLTDWPSQSRLRGVLFRGIIVARDVQLQRVGRDGLSDYLALGRRLLTWSHPPKSSQSSTHRLCNMIALAVNTRKALSFSLAAVVAAKHRGNRDFG